MQPKRIPWDFKHPFRLGFSFLGEFWPGFGRFQCVEQGGTRDCGGKANRCSRDKFFTEGPKLKNSRRECLKIKIVECGISHS